GRLRHELDAWQVTERLEIEREVGAPAIHAVVEYFKLRTPDRGQQIAEPVVVADLRMLVMERGSTGLGRKMADACRPLGAFCHQHCAAAGRDNFVAVEGVAADVGERSCGLVAVSGAQSFGSVFD